MSLNNLSTLNGVSLCEFQCRITKVTKRNRFPMYVPPIAASSRFDGFDTTEQQRHPKSVS